jgi:general secretion pathway protein F
MRFDVKAMREGEGVVALSLDAATEADATHLAQAQGYAVLSIRSQRALLSFGARSARFPLQLFSAELLALLKAGLSLVESIETLAEKEHRPETRKAIQQIITLLYEGRTFSQALQQLPDIFPPLYVASVRAAERTGDLPEALSRYIAYQAQIDVIRKKLVSASIYPVLLIGVGGLVTLFLLGFVVPRFSHIYDDIGGDLPVLSRILISWGRLLETHAWGLGVGALSLAVVGGYVLSRPESKRWLGHQLWKVPAIGERLRVYQLARFYRTLGMLLNGGIPVVGALDMVEGLLHPALRALMRQARQSIREGQSISAAMEVHQLTTPVALRMLRVGEQTGRMGEMMERIATFYDEEMARWVDWFTRLFEPLLMAFIGIVIGMIVVLLYLPIFELAGSLH